MHKIVLAVLFTTILFHTGTRAQETYIIESSGIPILFSTDKKDFPCRWRNKKIKAMVTPINGSERQRTIDLLEIALKKYPDAILKKNLHAIHAIKTMHLYGLEYGGTYHKRHVYITNNGIENDYSDAFIEGRFHHEFSSILLKRYSRFFNKRSWIAANPQTFEYGDGGRAALETTNTSLEMDSALIEHGFLNQYSLASLEEDFNCYAEFLFLSSEGFWKAWEENESIRKKTYLLISFYKKLDPVFTLEYFRGIGGP